MKLNVNDDRLYEPPELATLEEELRRLGPHEFAVLTAGEQRYMQTYHDEDGTFILEFRDGSPDTHFEAVEPFRDVADVVRAFSLYLQGDTTWKTLCKWQPVEL